MKTPRLAHNGFAYPLGVRLADGWPRDLTAEQITPVQTHPKTRTEVALPVGAESDVGCGRRRDLTRAAAVADLAFSGPVPANRLAMMTE